MSGEILNRIILTGVFAVVLGIQAAIWAHIRDHEERNAHEVAGVELRLLKHQVAVLEADHRRWVDQELNTPGKKR